MNTELFTRELRLLAPTKEDFEQYNVPESYISDYIKRYTCRPREGGDIINGNGVLDLLRMYDCSGVGIGNISFLYEIQDSQDFYQLGEVDLDIVVLNKITLEVEVRDHDDISHVIWRCAQNGYCFLDALLVCAQYLQSIFKNPSLEEDNKYALSMVTLSSEKAGGNQYIEFYKMLLGYFD